MPALVTTRHLPTAAPLRRLARRWAGRLVDPVRQWPVESQRAARRNAMVACTALAAHRAERDDVDLFLDSLPDVPVALPV